MNQNHYKYLDKFIEKIVNPNTYYLHYYLRCLREKTDIDKDLLMCSITNNPRISDRCKRILELAYNQDMRISDIAKYENVSRSLIDQIMRKAVEECVHEYIILKAEQNNKFEDIRELRLSNKTFHFLYREGITKIQDIYEYHTYISKKLGPATKKELLDALKSKEFDISVFE